MRKSPAPSPIRAHVLGAPPRHAATVGVFLVTLLTACGQIKQTGTEYLGRWNLSEDYCKCVLEIAKNGESFVIKSNNNTMNACDACRIETILTLSPEGNLTSGGVTLLSFDKAKNQVILSIGGGRMYYLSKLP
jgi:hypothetical protein